MKGFQKFLGYFQFVAISLLTTAVVVWLAAKLQLVPSDPPLSQNSPSSPSVVSTPAPSGDDRSSRPVSPQPDLYENLPSLPQQSSPQPVVPTTVPRVATAPKNFHGHLPYAEDEGSRLVSVGEFVRGTYRRQEYLDQEAATAFNQLLAAAAKANLTLQPISGFRSVDDQTELFEKQVQKYGSREAAAKLSAPPGYSEHHTGYAIDISDRDQPEKDLKLAFEKTTAYRWLSANAGNYDFELSFPPNNTQGVSFEPWHWRYIGTQRAAVQFASARS